MCYHLHSLLHFYKDIQRFGPMDNYSCWTEERAVHSYIKKSNNHKNIEVTFAHSEAHREFIKFRDTDNPMREFRKGKFVLICTVKCSCLSVSQ